MAGFHELIFRRTDSKFIRELRRNGRSAAWRKGRLASIMQDDAQKGSIDLQSAVVFDET
jgi:hypothetical protein